MEVEEQLSPGESPFLPLTRSIEKLRVEIHQVIVGQDQMIDQLLVALLTNGHILLEGVPGIAKTLTAKLFAKTISVGFSRIQFTPDLMPTDVLGTSVFNLKDSEFTFKQGPIFSNLILIDEINRAPAKTQAALFEVMEETQVTVDGKTYPMEFPFLVLATQNPIEQEGTYKLPEAQLDRFLFKVNLRYPSLDEEKTILKKFNEDFQLDSNVEIEPVLDSGEIKRYQELVETVHIKEELLAYIADIVHNTRENGNVYLGASPRASLAIMKSAKAMAAINSRPYVIPEDIQNACYPVLNHRLILTAEKEMEGLEVEGVIKDIIHEIEVPR
ncbi:MAG: AAA family ATPase [Cyclobacteriaceae bacterium]